MNFRNTLALLAIFAVLGGYVYFVEMQKPETPAATSDSAKYVFTMSPSDLQSLLVSDSGQSVFLVNDGQGKWFVGGIGGADADMTRVSSAVSYVASLQASRVITDLSGGLGIYGLETPKIEAVMSLSTGGSETLLVGDRTPQGAAYYAQRKGISAVYLIPEYFVLTLSSLVAQLPYLPTPTVVVTGTAVPKATLGVLPSVATVLPTVSVTATATVSR